MESGFLATNLIYAWVTYIEGLKMCVLLCIGETQITIIKTHCLEHLISSSLSRDYKRNKVDGYNKSIHPSHSVCDECENVEIVKHVKTNPHFSKIE